MSTTPTGYRYTGQRQDDTLGLYDYNARYYDPDIGRFISADTIVPGTFKNNRRLTPLTVSFHETIFLEKANNENNQLLLFGATFAWTKNMKQAFGVPSGPINPQALNRFAYTMNNPLRYTDPSGHEEWPEIPGRMSLTIVPNDDDYYIFEWNSTEGLITFRIHKNDPELERLRKLVQDFNEEREELSAALDDAQGAGPALIAQGFLAIFGLVISILGVGLAFSPETFGLSAIAGAILGTIALFVGIIALALTSGFGFGTIGDTKRVLRNEIEDVNELLYGDEGLFNLIDELNSSYQ